jgi:hypothetical protein
MKNAKTNPLRASRAVVLRLGEGPRMARIVKKYAQKQTHLRQIVARE